MSALIAMRGGGMADRGSGCEYFSRRVIVVAGNLPRPCSRYLVMTVAELTKNLPGTCRSACRHR
jgi:hypothetical protein